MLIVLVFFFMTSRFIFHVNSASNMATNLHCSSHSKQRSYIPTQHQTNVLVPSHTNGFPPYSRSNKLQVAVSRSIYSYYRMSQNYHPNNLKQHNLYESSELFIYELNSVHIPECSVMEFKGNHQ